MSTLQVLFPRNFKKTDLEGITLTKKMLIMKANHLGWGTPETERALDKAERAYLLHYAPRPFDTLPDSFLVELEKGQMKLEASLLEQGIAAPLDLSIKQFYALVDHYEDIAQKTKKIWRKE